MKPCSLTAKKEWTKYPKLVALDWRHLPAPSTDTDILIVDDRVLPLFRVTPEPDARSGGRADFFDCAGIRDTKYIPKPSEGGTLIVNEPFGGSVNPDSCLVQTRYSKRADAHNRRCKPEPANRLSGNPIERRKIFSFTFPIEGTSFFLTPEGHIDVRLCHLLFVMCPHTDDFHCFDVIQYLIN